MGLDDVERTHLVQVRDRWWNFAKRGNERKVKFFRTWLCVCGYVGSDRSKDPIAFILTLRVEAIRCSETSGTTLAMTQRGYVTLLSFQ